VGKLGWLTRATSPKVVYIWKTFETRATYGHRVCVKLPESGERLFGVVFFKRVQNNTAVRATAEARTTWRLSGDVQFSSHKTRRINFG